METARVELFPEHPPQSASFEEYHAWWHKLSKERLMIDEEISDIVYGQQPNPLYKAIKNWQHVDIPDSEDMLGSSIARIHYAFNYDALHAAELTPELWPQLNPLYARLSRIIDLMEEHEAAAIESAYKPMAEAVDILLRQTDWNKLLERAINQGIGRYDLTKAMLSRIVTEERWTDFYSASLEVVGVRHWHEWLQVHQLTLEEPTVIQHEPVLLSDLLLFIEPATPATPQLKTLRDLAASTQSPDKPNPLIPVPVASAFVENAARFIVAGPPPE